VLQAAEEIGYRANRSASLLARRRTRLIGVPVVVSDAFRAELAEEIQDAADEAGYAVAISAITRRHDERRVLETLLELRCEALVLLSPELEPDGLAALARQLPVVTVGLHLAAVTPGVDSVRAADDEGVTKAVEHLLALGHRAVAHVDGGDAAWATDRRSGYERAMADRGIAGLARVLRGGHSEAAGAAAARALLDEGTLPSAIVAANDRCAVGLLDVFIRAGVQVPGDVSVVGFDDGLLARLPHVDLTTVSQQADLQAQQAVAAVVERLDGGRKEPRALVLPSRLVVRGTTGPPRG